MPHVLSWDKFIERKTPTDTPCGALRAQRSQWLSQNYLYAEVSTMVRATSSPSMRFASHHCSRHPNWQWCPWQVRINSDAPTTDFTTALTLDIRVRKGKTKKWQPLPSSVNHTWKGGKWQVPCSIRNTWVHVDFFQHYLRRIWESEIFQSS